MGITLNMKTRKLVVSYPIEDICKDYETIKQVVYKCRGEGLRCYFTIDSNKKRRYFIISSEDWKILHEFSKQL